MKIGIVIIATNAYFVLGVRLVNKFIKHYKGNNDLKFYFFSDTDPKYYTKYSDNIKHIPQKHSSWVNATNSKFNNIILLDNEDCDYIFYLDADTNINKDFNDDNFIGDVVGGEHFGNQFHMKDQKPFERNPKSKAYIPKDTTLSQMYYYGAFFGGLKNKVIEICKTLSEWQETDKKIHFEPIWNDESYLNCYFHFNPPSKTIPSKEFCFSVSDKGGIENTRSTSVNTDHIKQSIILNKDKNWDIRQNKFTLQ